METQTEKSVTCWNCGKSPDEVHFCQNCDSLQPPASDYFQYLGLPHKLQIDLAALEKNFYRLSRRLHPDVYFRRSEQERQLSVDATALLNDAYRTLKDRVARAEYLLGLHGVKKSGPESPNAPPELLEEVFELNMALEEIRRGEHSVLPQLVEAKAKFAGLLAETDRALENCFAEWDLTGRREALDRTAAVLNRRNYIRNLLREVNAALV